MSRTCHPRKSVTMDKFDKTLQTLIAEFEKSGLGIDDFIRQQLKKNGRNDSEQFVTDLNSTLSDIDAKYTSLQEARKAGKGREEWLRTEIDDAVRDLDSRDAGKVLSSTIKVLSGETDDTPDENANYEGVNAVDLIHGLNSALETYTCAELMPDEEEK